MSKDISHPELYQEFEKYFYYLHPKYIDLSLERISNLLEKLGSPHLHLPPTIHVAGTNGKGSTLSFLRAIYEAAGLKVHVYTSPHLIRLNERIRLQGELITDEAFIHYLHHVQVTNAEEPLTFFEALTAAAFLAFKECPADVLLLETGLGGRLDATNVISNPLACVLTPISLDHQEFLGQTLQEIAREKAEIIKKNTKVFIGEQPKEIQSLLLEKVLSMGAKSFIKGKEWSFSSIFSSETYPLGSSFRLTFCGQEYNLPPPSLRGDHQLENAALATAVALGLQSTLPVPIEAVKQGLQAAQWPGRLQRLTKGQFYHPLREVWLDGAHNAQGFEMLGRFMKSLQEQDKKEIIMMVAILKNRPLQPFFDVFSSLVDQFIFIEMPDKERFHSCSYLASLASTSAQIFSLRELSDFFKCKKLFGSRIFIAGSLYLIGSVLEINTIKSMEEE